MQISIIACGDKCRVEIVFSVRIGSKYREKQHKADSVKMCKFIEESIM